MLRAVTNREIAAYLGKAVYNKGAFLQRRDKFAKEQSDLYSQLETLVSMSYICGNDSVPALFRSYITTIYALLRRNFNDPISQMDCLINDDHTQIFLDEQPDLAIYLIARVEVLMNITDYNAYVVSLLDDIFIIYELLENANNVLVN